MRKCSVDVANIDVVQLASNKSVHQLDLSRTRGACILPVYVT